MNEMEQAALSALKACTYYPGSGEKKFVNQLKRDAVMTEKQRLWFWKIVIRYRGQHKRHMLVDYAKEQLKEQE